MKSSVLLFGNYADVSFVDVYVSPLKFGKQPPFITPSQLDQDIV